MTLTRASKLEQDDGEWDPLTCNSCRIGLYFYEEFAHGLCSDCYYIQSQIDNVFPSNLKGFPQPHISPFATNCSLSSLGV